MKQLTVIKIGGKVIDDSSALELFLKDFAKIGGSKILVHGGGKIATDFGQKLGIEPNYIEGRRITDAPTLELVTMVYGGLVNKGIVTGLQANGLNAIGLSGADANILPAVKRSVQNIDYGFVGDLDVTRVEVEQLSGFLDNGLCPVFCPLTHDQNGSLLNTNADTIASVLSSALSTAYEVNLVYCFEQKGVLSDFKNQVVIPKIDSLSYQQLKEEKIINEGMIPKMDNAFDALKSGVQRVTIGHYTAVQSLVAGETEGTVITL